MDSKNAEELCAQKNNYWRVFLISNFQITGGTSRETWVNQAEEGGGKRGLFYKACLTLRIKGYNALFIYFKCGFVRGPVLVSSIFDWQVTWRSQGHFLAPPPPPPPKLDLELFCLFSLSCFLPVLTWVGRVFKEDKLIWDGCTKWVWIHFLFLSCLLSPFFSF